MNKCLDRFAYTAYAKYACPLRKMNFALALDQTKILCHQLFRSFLLFIYLFIYFFILFIYFLNFCTGYPCSVCTSAIAIRFPHCLRKNKHSIIGSCIFGRFRNVTSLISSRRCSYGQRRHNSTANFGDKTCF